jgi:hypothetical protein
MAIKPQIETFFFKGSCIFHMIAMGSREQIISVTIEHPIFVSVNRVNHAKQRSHLLGHRLRKFALLLASIRPISAATRH